MNAKRLALLSVILACQPAAEREVLLNPGFATFEHWRLAEWASPTPLRALGSNATRSVTLVPGGITLSLDSDTEYNHANRTPESPWIHLLVEQDFPPVALSKRLLGLRLRLKIEVLAHETFTDGPGYDLVQHGTLFPVYLIAEGADPHDVVWIGLPAFDSRWNKQPAQQFVDYAGNPIFTIAHEFTRNVDLDVLPKLRDAIERAFALGLVSDGDPTRYAVKYLNLGFEALGRSISRVMVRDLSMIAREAR